MVTMHHIITDGWSMGVLVREVAALYEAYSRGEESPLAELKVQYADYASWQRSWLQGEVLERELQYWKEQLQGAPSVLELPTDRAREGVSSNRGGYVEFLLERELSNQLRQLSRREGVTLFMTLLAAFKTLLYRYSGQEDVVVGTNSANRNRSEIENLIGFFVNNLVLRTKLSGGMSFRELLKTVREVVLGAYSHQDLPFEKLVEVLQPKRVLNRTPLFQVVFTLQSAPMIDLELPGLTLQSEVIGRETAKYELVCNLLETSAGVAGGLEYNSELFDPTTINRMLRHYKKLLGALVAQPDAPLNLLEMLSDEEETLLDKQVYVEELDESFLF